MNVGQQSTMNIGVLRAQWLERKEGAAHSGEIASRLICYRQIEVIRQSFSGGITTTDTKAKDEGLFRIMHSSGPPDQKKANKAKERASEKDITTSRNRR